MAFRAILRTICSRDPCLPPISSTRYLNGSFKTQQHIFGSCYWVNQAQNCRNLCSIPQDDHVPPQDVVIKSMSIISNTSGEVGETTNVVKGGTVADDLDKHWLALDQKVNSYPSDRGFTAIGTGGEGFVHSMIVAVESILEQPIPEGQVKHKTSSGGKYVSVSIGPVRVSSSQQVQAVYNAMRRDDRIKYSF